MASPLFFAIFALCLVDLFILIYKPRVGIFFLFATKPIIDASWQYTLFGYNNLEFIGVAVPLIIIYKMVFSEAENPKDFPLLTIWLLLLLSSITSFALIASTSSLMSAFDFLFRVLNGFIGFYMFLLFIVDKQDFKYLLISLLIGGIFPIGTGIYQLFTGQVWQVRQTVGLVRYVGFYHDSFSFRSYSLMTISAIFLYWSYFSTSSLFRKFLFVLYFVGCSIVLYRVYSKAGYLIYALWNLVWFLFKRNIFIFSLLILIFLVIGFQLNQYLFSEIETIFSKEISALEGTGDPKYILSGRTIVWKNYFKMWQKSNLFQKFFGLGFNGANAHNELLRILITSGIFGLSFYAIFIFVVGLLFFRNLFLSFTSLNLMSFLIFAMWNIDSIGLVPGMFPAYQWFVWGFVGLSLGNNALHKMLTET